MVINNGQHEAKKGAHLELFKLLLARGASTAAPPGKWTQTLQEVMDEYEGSEDHELFKAALDAHEAAALHP